MQIFITGNNQIDMSEAFRKHVEDGLHTLSTRHKVDPVDVHVQLSKDNVQFRADIFLHLDRGVVIRGHEFGADGYMAVDNTINHLTHRLRRHKERLVTHQKRQHDSKEQALKIMASQYILAPEETEGDAPIIIAELPAEIPSLSVSEAVMRLDLSDEPTFVFRNHSHGALNVVYRRSDGNIGWIDPQQS